MLRDDRSCNWCAQVQLYLNHTQNRNFFVTPMDTAVTVLSSLRVTRISIVWLYVIYNLHRKNRKIVKLLRLFQGDIQYNLARYRVFTNLSGVRSKEIARLIFTDIRISVFADQTFLYIKNLKLEKKVYLCTQYTAQKYNVSVNNTTLYFI